MREVIASIEDGETALRLFSDELADGGASLNRTVGLRVTFLPAKAKT